MLENLDTISWSTLTHAYGSASDVPGQIRALTSNNKKKRDRALWELYGNIFHQGTRYEATPYAIPFLYELLDMSSIEEKEKIIYLLVNLALGYEEEYLPEGFDPKYFRCHIAKLNLTPNERSEYEKYGFSPPVVIDCYDAVLKGVPLLLKLLDNPEVKIRQAATYALAWFPEIANDSVRTIRNRLERESDDLSIANIILAIGLLARQSKHEINL
jgi:hypothetical protein